MKSIGIDFQPHIDTGLIQINASRPMAYGLEMHLIAMFRLIDRFEPAIVIIDPISNMTNVGTQTDVKFMLTKLIRLFEAQEYHSCVHQPGRAREH